jgi:hypothetical protein
LYYSTRCGFVKGDFLLFSNYFGWGTIKREASCRDPAATRQRLPVDPVGLDSVSERDRCFGSCRKTAAPEGTAVRMKTYLLSSSGSIKAWLSYCSARKNGT